MRRTGTLLAVTSAFVALAATSAYATSTVTTTTPCSSRGSHAWALFKAGSTTTWGLQQHATNGQTEADSPIGRAAVTQGVTYRVEVTDPNWVTLSLSVIDDTSSVAAAGPGHCDAPAGVNNPGGPIFDLVPLPGPGTLPVATPDLSAIFG